MSTVEEVETLTALPVTEAIEVPAEDATPRDEGGHRKRSRIREVFSDDPDDLNYVVSRECRGQPYLRWPPKAWWQHNAPLDTLEEETSMHARQVEQSGGR